ncbi:MAG: hypothetical protein KGJ49_09565 [Alphaproteobacteria bacterium]|nr:hypothetical protein [Alphaproteobacteria bacterium]
MASLFGLPAEEITALGTLILAVATAGLVVVAWRQLPILNGQLAMLANQIEESRKATQAADQRTREIETLHACRRDESEPVLVEAERRIWDASDGGKNYRTGKVNQHDLIIVLNHMDGIAIGVIQGLYLEAMVKDHMGLMYKKVVEEIFPSKVIDTDGYEAILELYGRLYPNPRAKVEYAH